MRTLRAVKPAIPAETDKCPWCGSTITHAKFLQIQARIREEERRKSDEVREKLLKEAAKQIELAKQQAEQQKKKEIAEIRAILQKDRDNALLKKEAEFARERANLEKKIVEMSRRVKKGGDIGEGAELDLFEELRGAFPEDQFSRVKGTPGVIVHSLPELLIDVGSKLLPLPVG